MYRVRNQEGNYIEIALSETVNRDEYGRVISLLQSLCAKKPKINILFDAVDLSDSYSFKIFLDESMFYKKYKSHLNRVAFVSEMESEIFLLSQFFNQKQFKTFDSKQIQRARKWIAESSSSEASQKRLRKSRKEGRQ